MSGEPEDLTEESMVGVIEQYKAFMANRTPAQRVQDAVEIAAQYDRIRQAFIKLASDAKAP